MLDTGAEENPIPDISIFEGAPSKYEVFNGLLGVALRNHAPIPIFQFLLTRAPRETYYGWAGKRVLGCILEIYEAPDSIQLVSMFPDSGADPNAEDRHESSGWNCCYTAAAHGVKHRNWDFTKLCLDRGSSMEYGTSKGHHRSLMHLLVRDAYEIESGFAEASDKDRDRTKSMNFLNVLLSHPTSKEMGIIDVPDFQGITPLMWAIFWALPSCVAVPVENGANTLGQWLGKPLPALVDVCKTFRVPEGFDISNDKLTLLSKTMEIQSILPYYSKAAFLKRWDEISFLLRSRTSAS